MVGTLFALGHKEPVKASALGSQYTLLESPDQLGNGDSVVIAATSRQIAMGGQGSKYVNGVEVSISGATLVDESNSAKVFTVEKNGNMFSFKTSDNKYLTTSSSSATTHNKEGYLQYIATSGTVKSTYSSFSLTSIEDGAYMQITVASGGEVSGKGTIRCHTSTLIDSGPFRAYSPSSGSTIGVNIYVFSTNVKRVYIDDYSHVKANEVGVGNIIEVTATLESITPASFVWSVPDSDKDKIDLYPETSEVKCYIQFLQAVNPLTLTLTVIDETSTEYTDSIDFNVIEYNYTLEEGAYYINTKVNDKYVYLNNSFSGEDNDVTSIGLFASDGVITFEYAYKGDDTYYLYYNGYCVANSSNSRITKVIDEPDTYWTLSKDNDTGKYKFVDQATSKILAYEPSMDNYGKFMCFQTLQSTNVVWFDVSPQWTWSEYHHNDVTPDKTTYEVGDTFSPEGMELTVEFVDADSVHHIIDITDEYEWSELTSSSTKVTGTISLAGHSDEIVVDVTVFDYQLDSIAVNASGAKTEYIEGQSVKKTGLVVTATYKAQGAVDKVETLNDNDYTVYPEKVGRNTTKVTVSYGGKSTSYNVDVTPNYFIHCEDNDKVRPGHRVIFTNPTYEVEMKNDFFGQEYDEVPAAVGQFEVELGNKAKTIALKTDENKYLGMSGTKVALEDSVTDTSSWTVVLANDYCYVENAGNANYYLSYNYQNNKFQVYENGLSGDAFAEVWIDENSTPEVFIDHIELDTNNVQKEFTVGDAFSYVGLVVRTVDELNVKTVVNDYVVIAPDMSSAGQKTVRVTYQDGMFEATYKITVNSKDSGGGSGGGSSGGSSTSDGDSEDSSTAKKTMNLPLILGLSIGGGVLVLGGAGLAIFLILKKKRKH